MELRFSGPSRLADVLPARLGPITTFPFTIGRGKQAGGCVQATPATLGVGEESVAIISRAHAWLERVADGSLLVRDLNSVNGTWWIGASPDPTDDESERSQENGGTRVRLHRSGVTEHALGVGDSVCFGHKVVRYTLRAPSAPDAPAPAAGGATGVPAGTCRKRASERSVGDEPTKRVKVEPTAVQPTATLLAEPRPEVDQTKEVNTRPEKKANQAPSGEAAGAASACGDSMDWVDEEIQCCVCMGPLAFAASLGCGHMLCWVCVHQLLTCGRTPLCPQCREPARQEDLRRNPGVDSIVSKFIQRNRSKIPEEEQSHWDRRYEEGKRLEADHRKNPALARVGSASGRSAAAPTVHHRSSPAPAMPRANVGVGITVQFTPCSSSPCEVCGGRAAAPDPRPGVVGEQLAAVLRITGLPAPSAAAVPHQIHQRLIGNRGRTFHLECADLPALIGQTAHRARPQAINTGGRAAGEVVVTVSSELDASTSGWQRAQARALVVASLRARLRLAAGSSEWWWRCNQAGGVWQADPEAGEEVWSDGEGVDEVAASRARSELYRRDSFINDDEDEDEDEDDEDEDDEDEDEEDGEEEEDDFVSEEEEEEESNSSDSSMERYRRRGW